MIKSTLNIIRKHLNKILAKREHGLTRNKFDVDCSPVFIIGAPRSGTTLLLQALIGTTNFDYFSNLQCALCGCPALTANVLKKQKSFNAQSFTSNYGTTKGLSGPSECGSFWYRFFPEDPDLEPPVKEMQCTLTRLRNSISLITLATEKPLLLKNLQNVTRLAHLQFAFPNAIFIYVTRNLFENACSVLHARLPFEKDTNSWWSIKPNNWKKCLAKGPVDRTLAQISLIQGQIESHFSQFTTPRIIRIQYEKFCESPNVQLDKLIAQLKHFGCDINQTRHLTDRFEQPDISLLLAEDIKTELRQKTEALGG